MDRYFHRFGRHRGDVRIRGDTTARSPFAGLNCGLCRTDWDVQRKYLSRVS